MGRISRAAVIVTAILLLAMAALSMPVAVLVTILTNGGQ